MENKGLRWPERRPRTPAGERKYGRFSQTRDHGGWHSHEGLTIAIALSRLNDEAARLGCIYQPIVSCDMEMRRDGQPKSGAKKPEDPGVAVYFELDGDEMVLCCDRFTEVAQNIAAIAAHIDKTRAIERYGVASAKEMFHAFLALPDPGSKRPWWQVLEVSQDASADTVKAAYRRLSMERHPDRATGSHEMMAELTEAYREASDGG